MEISNQLRDAALEMARRHATKGIRLPAEIPNNPGMCLGTEAEKDQIQVFSTVQYEGTTYLIGTCTD